MKHAITAIAAIAALAAAAAPASAQVLQRSIETSADGYQVSSTNGTSTVVFACSALATPDAAATTVQACYLLGQDGVRYDGSGTPTRATSGPAHATVKWSLSVPAQDYQVCTLASALWRDTTITSSALNCNVLYRFN